MGHTIKEGLFALTSNGSPADRAAEGGQICKAASRPQVWTMSLSTDWTLNTSRAMGDFLRDRTSQINSGLFITGEVGHASRGALGTIQ